ncbi:Tex family protein [Effusibacillus dendaii]|uniref:RNA-binding transcriptional accessory protein n=1 Tax=Effusibacillus dendaii TaxID=2743772 RepID=A0A7I8DAI7_9BACL|nr:Tex family protein [Effusibacillus dendaii]BCJ87198.1 RNA-binding transcriptional accessory protein [Effusibacillus dendaii]
MVMEAPDFAQIIAEELKLKKGQAERTIGLLDEGNTVPFIARYRKEMTGELDENQIRVVQERLASLRNLHGRKQEIYRLISEQEKMTDEIGAAIQQAKNLTEVEDIYRPFRPKRKTRASVAKEKGLQPLAEWLLQDGTTDPLLAAADYIVPEKGVESAEEALQGALDIVAEEVSDDIENRKFVREFTLQKGAIVCKASDSSVESVYEAYYDYEEPLAKVPPHRILAMNRGEREDFLKVSVKVPAEELLSQLQRRFFAKLNQHRSADLPHFVTPYLQAAVEDAYKRLIAPAVEREVRAILTEKAEEQAIKVFSGNLRQLLLQPPVRGKTVMGIDPAYRTGCKIAVVDETGKLLDIAVTYPTPPQNKTEEARRILAGLIEKHQVDVIAIGNGTASRETEQFVAELLKQLPRQLMYVIVSEAGASVYSASKLAGEEFPTLDVAERSAISIARRLQDPLAELVKIDPKSVGVGQYQHDVSQKRLEEQLTFVVESSVNQVGVDLNTSSASLLSYVSGLTASIAKSIVAHREKNGKFARREQLAGVPRLGPKTFQQAAGFLRIPDGDYPLDNTPIHPESYQAAEALIKKLGFSLDSLHDANQRESLKQALQQVNVGQMADELQIGAPTLRDIVEALQKPGRDPREELEPPVFRTDVLKIEDLAEGMILKGTVRNVVDFGAFIDIGLKNDGLVHVSELADRFVRHPMNVVSVGDIVNVKVIHVDLKKGRVGLSMRGIQ